MIIKMSGSRDKITTWTLEIDRIIYTATVNVQVLDNVWGVTVIKIRTNIKL